ncbi:leucine carboxyl methyltransferase 1 [Kwoniella mangroviensis CBS 8886]|nr:leucine carboxyl methyltransferase 1 [Kwoniella mangroviensis CBS 8886]
MLPPSLPSRNGNGNGSGSGMIHPDDAIRQTDDDASSSRASAISLGYLTDPFSAILYKPSFSSGISSSSIRKPPLINIGTHHRTIGIDTLVNRFLDSDGGQVGKQIVSLGAGSDTRFWRLLSRNDTPNISKYIEIDFPHLTSPKAHRISRSKKLYSYLSPEYKISQGGTRLDSPNYTLLPLDLRPTPTKSIHQLLDEHLLPLLDPKLPTLFLAECLFPYMPPEDSQDIISWFGSRFVDCIGVIYEMSGLGDSFGKVMKRNLASRNLSIPGSEPFPTPRSQAQRFLDPSLGKGMFENSGVKTLWQVRGQVIDSEELSRISKLEILDEIEELKLVLEHYVIAWGIKGDKLTMSKITL